MGFSGVNDPAEPENEVLKLRYGMGIFPNEKIGMKTET
jgi:hypothetical protein